MMAEKRVMFRNDYNKQHGPSHGSGNFNKTKVEAEINLEWT